MVDTLQVWIGCLHCYNSGYLTGDWFDADSAGDVTVRRVHRDGKQMSGCEEIWCFDTDGFDGFIDGECSPCHAQHVAEIVSAVDDDLREAFRGFVKHHGEHDEPISHDLVEKFRDAYRGSWTSEQEFTLELVSDLVSKEVRESEAWTYVDFAEWTRDLFSTDFWSHQEGHVFHVFADC